MVDRGKHLRRVVADGGVSGHNERCREGRVALVLQLQARRAEIAEAIFARVSDSRFEQTGREDPEYAAGLRRAGEAALDYVLIGIEYWGQTLAPVPEEAIAQARRAARMGVASETVLRRYFAGYSALEGFVMYEAAHGVLRGEEAALSNVLHILAVLTDRLVATVADEHRRERERRDESAGPGAGSGDGAARHGEGPRTELTGAQRERILRAVVEIVAERGYAGATVGAIAERARVGRPTFYKLCPSGLDDGLAAVIDHGAEQVGARVARAFGEHEGWREGIRAALASVLAFLDADPQLARVLMVDTLGGCRAVAEHREQAVRVFCRLIVTQIGEQIPQSASPLAAQGAIASVMAIVRSHLSSSKPEPLIELLSPLLGVIAEPLAGREVAVKEMRLGEKLARAIQAGEVTPAPARPGTDSNDIEQPAILANPNARRLRECLLYVAMHPDASNRAVAAGIGVAHKSQICKLLAQLEDEGLVIKHSSGPGVPNRWRLTAYGEDIAPRAVRG